MSSVENGSTSVANVDSVTREVARCPSRLPRSSTRSARWSSDARWSRADHRHALRRACAAGGRPRSGEDFDGLDAGLGDPRRLQAHQFTPDLLPADLLGTLIYSPKDGTFTPRRVIFTNIVLADEINRGQGAVGLLESMQERQVTIGDTTYPLPSPFLVLATQNPIEQEGRTRFRKLRSTGSC